MRKTLWQVMFILAGLGVLGGCAQMGPQLGRNDDSGTNVIAAGQTGKPNGVPDTANGKTEKNGEKATNQDMVTKDPTLAIFNAQVYDTSCKSMVEPFELSANIMSMAKLGAALATITVMQKNNVNGSAGSRENMDTRGLLKMAGKNMNWLPMAIERKIGETMHERNLDNLLNFDVEDKSIQKISERAKGMLDKILMQVKEKTPYDFQIFVRKKNGRNAQALPGGFIYLDQGLLEKAKKQSTENVGKKTDPKNKKNESKNKGQAEDLSLEYEAYFTLAHEISHILQRHESRSVQSKLTDTVDSIAMLRKVMADPANASIDAGSKAVTGLAWGSFMLGQFEKYTKDQELQADACAMRLLHGVYNGNRAEMTQVVNVMRKKFAKDMVAGVAQDRKVPLKLLQSGAPPNVRGVPLQERPKFKKITGPSAAVDLGNAALGASEHPEAKERISNLERMLVEIYVPPKPISNNASSNSRR